MSLVVFFATVLGLSISAGVIGSLAGLGGGIIVVPLLSLVMGVDIRYAIGASLVSVIATSSASAATYVKTHLCNIRVAFLLEMGTTLGALSGAFLAGIVPHDALYIVFAVVLVASTIGMLFKKQKDLPDSQSDEATVQSGDFLADRLDLHSSYYDAAEKREIFYRVRHTPLGLVMGFLAGILSGLLGIGGGPLKVPTMNLAMNLPIKACTATSNLMVGVTAAASTSIYFLRGDINPFIAGPVALGVLAGALLGARFLSRLKGKTIRAVLVVVFVGIAVEMFWKGIQ